MVRSLLLAGLLATSAASAQGVALSYASQDSETLRVNATQCAARLRINWESTVTFGLCSGMELWSTDQQCADAPTGSANEVRYPDVEQSALALQTGNFEVPIAELPAFRSNVEDGGVSCGAEGIERSHKICGRVQLYPPTGVGACTTSQARSLTLVYDTKPPGAPTISDVSDQDGALLLTFSAPSDAVIVHFDVRALGSATFVEKGEIATLNATTIRVAGLVNGTTYEVQARSEDAAENFSPPSELVVGTPRLTKGFFGIYRDAGGAERGGCTAGPGLPLLLAGGLWLLRRKRT